MFSSVLLAITFAPTSPQMTPSGLRKSFYGSVITSAVSLGDEFMLILSCWTGPLPASSGKLTSRPCFPSVESA